MCLVLLSIISRDVADVKFSIEPIPEITSKNLADPSPLPSKPIVIEPLDIMLGWLSLPIFVRLTGAYYLMLRK